MPPTVRSIPVNYPQPLASHILKADAQRQISMLRQEMVSDLLGVLAEAREPNVRSRLVKVIESNLRCGLAAAQRADDLWPTLEQVKEVLRARTDCKPAAARKHLKLFEQYDRVQRRSLDLLSESFGNIGVILDRIQPPQPAAKPEPAAPSKR